MRSLDRHGRIASVAIAGIVLILHATGPLWAATPAAVAPADSVALDSLMTRLGALYQAGKYTEVDSSARAAIRDLETVGRGESLQAARFMDLVLMTDLRAGKSTAPGLTEFAERAVAIKEKALGPDHAEVGMSLSQFGQLMSYRNQVPSAKATLRRALAIQERALGSDHPDVGSTVTYLANTHMNASEYDTAKTGYERALAIWTKAYGPGDRLVGYALNNLANAKVTLGDYSEALTLYERAIAVGDSTLGPNHPEVARRLYNLGRLRASFGDPAAALPLLQRSLAIREKALGARSALVGAVVWKLGMVYEQLGDRVKAAESLERALAIREKALVPDHPDVAVTLVSLGDLKRLEGDLAGARALYERAVAAYERPGTSNPTHVASSLMSLARLLAESGEPDSARTLYERALALKEKVLGSEHPELASLLAELAKLDLAGGRATALDRALRADAIDREHLRLVCRALSEDRALKYAGARFFGEPSGLDVALSMAAGGLDGASRARVWDALVRSRGVVLDEMAARNQVLIGSQDSEITRLRQAVISAGQRLANLSVRGPGDEADPHYRDRIETARNEKEQADRALTQKSTIYRRRQEQIGLGLADVAAALPQDHVLVAFARYTDVAPGDSVPTEKGSSARGPALVSRLHREQFLAFILRDARRDPDVVPLGDAETIDSLVARLGDEVERMANLRAGSAAAAETRYRAAGEALRRAVWDPVAAHLDSIRGAFVVPDGSLALVNFSALPSGTTSYLVETGPIIHYLSTERDLVRATGGERREGLMALGGPDFDAAGALATDRRPRQEREALDSKAIAGTFRAPPAHCGDFQSLKFSPLPGSLREVRELTHGWRGVWSHGEAQRGEPARSGDVLLLTGADATEAAFKRDAPDYGVLHLATHGFFLGGRCPSAAEPARGVTGMTVAEGEENSRSAIGDNPLLLSGVALAGANRRAASRLDEEDGVLTAAEIAALDLTGTRWAVLSACETGLGELHAGEGVVGLRRAFQVAGTGTVIMSLWAVGDVEARAWMHRLYEARFERGSSTAAAVREATLASLRERRAHRQNTHPFYWAAFVAAGDWN